MGTHYSTTHPPPPSQNSTSSRCCSFSFPFLCLRLRRSHVSLSLSLFRIPGPLLPTSRWLVLQARTTFGPLSTPLSLFLPVHSCAHPARCTAKLFRMYSYIAWSLCVYGRAPQCAHTHTHTYMRARETHLCSILFSFHLSFYPTPLLCQSLFLLFLLRSSAKRNPRM